MKNSKNSDQEKIRRILRLIFLLSSEQGITVEEMCVDLKITERTVRRYLQSFKICGLNIIKFKKKNMPTRYKCVLIFENGLIGTIKPLKTK